jgi:Flp pilus assembly protein TadG
MVFRDRRAGVALIVAMATPLLIAITGLSVDAGYWYQQQENLQSAADAAALNAAMNDAVLNVTTTGAAKAAAALPGATAAADSATNQQFGFVAGTGGAAVSLVANMNTPSANITQYIATAKIPRGGFFSKVLGPGLVALGAGYQSATATAIIETETIGNPSRCNQLFGTSGNDIYATGGARLTATNCGIEADSTSCAGGDSDSISAQPSAIISAQSVSSAGCINQNTNGGAHVEGTGGNASNSYNQSVVYQNHAASTDPLASLASAPASWPAMPSMPDTPTAAALPSGLTYTNITSGEMGYVNTPFTPSSAGDCTYQGSYTAKCEIFPGAYTGLNSFSVASLVMNQGTSTGTTYVSGGFTGQSNGALTLNGSTFYINGGMNDSAGGAITLNGNNYYVSGGTTLTDTGGYAVTLAAGNYYFTGATNSNGFVGGTGLSVTTSNNFTAGAGNYYINGGLNVTNAATSIGNGTDYFSGVKNANGTIVGTAINVGGSSSSFSLGTGTHYINGGVSITNAATTFNAGTYYLKGYLNVTNGAVGTYAVNLNTPSFTTGAGTYYFNGGFYTGNNPTITLGQGTYLFNTIASESNGAFDNSSCGCTIVFTGGTYFFDGGFTAGARSNITFGPGIYYIRGGNLNFSNGSTVTANGATFVLEGTAGYEFNGGTAMNLSAPSQNAAGTACVEPFYQSAYPNAAIYPVSTYTLPSTNPPATPNSYAPYDGTNGEGICGILIYQARGDTTADSITEGANSIVNGIIYAHDAALSVSGGATISSSTSLGFAILQSSESLTGSGTINITAPPGSLLYSNPTTIELPLLTN